MHNNNSGSGFSPTNNHNPLTRYSLLGAAQQMEDLAIQQKPLLGSLCLSGEATVWYARYNTGKTLFCLHFIIEAVQQRRIAPCDIIYINADDSSAGLAQKVRLLQDSGVHVVAPGWNGFKANMLLGKMDEMITTDTAHGKLIVIDTLKKFVDVMDKKRSREFTETIRAFVMRGGTLLALAHTNKRLGPDGKPIPEGTADILNDFDCGYVLNFDGETDHGDHMVEFERVKSRGPSVLRALYSYDPDPELSYIQRLCSVQELDMNNVHKADDTDSEDSEIIEAIQLSIHHGSVQKMDIVRTASMGGRISRRRVLAVLDQYTGDELGQHHWNYTVHARGAKVYALLEPLLKG